MKKILGIILARTSSIRLNRKVLIKPFNNHVLLIDYFIKRLKKCKKINKIVLATSTKKNDKILVKIAKKNNLDVVTGSEKDVLSRIVKTINIYGKNYNYIVRANSDCPLFMPTIQDIHIKNFINSKKDLFSPFKNNIEPFGFSFCLFKKNTILKLDKMAKKKIYREHVENYCFHNKEKFSFYKLKDTKFNFPDLKLTLDNYEDLIKIKYLLNKLNKYPIKKQPRKLIDFFKN